MKKQLLTLATAAVLAVGSPAAAQQDMHKNPFLEPYTTPYQIPPFGEITYADYLPALKQGLAEFEANVKAIVDNPDTPTFDNTVLAFDNASPTLDKVVLVFSALEESNSSPEMIAIAEEFYPLYSQAQDKVMMNDGLFKRFKYLYDHRAELGLAPDQVRAVETYYKNFTRAGALLDQAQKDELMALNTELTNLYRRSTRICWPPPTRSAS